MLLGIPEAYILNRMSPPWRGMFLLIVIGPLLISVVARTLGLGAAPGFDRDLEPRPHFPRPPENTRRVHVQRDRRDHRAHTRPRALHDPVCVGFAPAPRPAGGERGDLARRNSIRRAAAGGAATGRCRASSPARSIVFALAASAFATPAIIGGRRLKVAATLAYDEFLNTLNWPLGAAVATLLLIALVAAVVSSNRMIERRYAQVFE